VTTYVDSSALVPVYVPERFSEAARQIVRAAAPVPFTQLHDLEVPNTFELLVGRGSISRQECQAVHAQLYEDLDTARLTRTALDLDVVFAGARELSRTCTARYLARSLDLLHIAAAHVAMCTTFASADDRQLQAARATGLDVLDIKRRVPRRAR
jgi:predicted nucleic acid-binding protein